ncbi:basic membrane protein A [Microbacterium sp. W4I4]|uniref:BMP family lipoprotein n=1 Tax=Microbacterium sp. W4I4 TaxID=3042295 RepID=UPI00277DD206|nr:BMP family ABC transporter substrate-binding protein [Microbacterium sp. W4I4]MDQ0614064.1 basic membrane protein A [Microbacterium sp. W4I4]
MKISRFSTVAAAAALVVTLSACTGPAETPSGTDDGASGEISVAHVVPGALGDQGFFDDAQSGMDKLEGDGHETNTLQADGNNPAQWKANLQSVSTGEWDVIVTGTFSMFDILTEDAPKFPDQHYILYDAVVDAPNVASITYMQNEGSFLAGVLAALATTETDAFPLSEGSKKVGLVGGQDVAIINDFVVGFEAGVEAVDPTIEVLVSYVGSFTDSAKGYDQAKAMYDQGADVVYVPSGGSAIGSLQAAKDSNKYAIGVNINQNDLQPGHVLGSMLKNAGGTIVTAIAQAQEGTLKYGEATSFGLANDGVGLTFEGNGDLVPQSIIDQIEKYKQEVVDGSIAVPTTLG